MTARPPESSPDRAVATSSSPESPISPVADDCPTCGGFGWVVDHGGECYETGECVGGEGCPTREQCWDFPYHADPCTHCDGHGQVWDPRVHGNIVSCSHCAGGWIWRDDIGDAGAHDASAEPVGPW